MARAMRPLLLPLFLHGVARATTARTRTACALARAHATSTVMTTKLLSSYVEQWDTNPGAQQCTACESHIDDRALRFRCLRNKRCLN
jgi:hypothetical protein